MVVVPVWAVCHNIRPGSGVWPVLPGPLSPHSGSGARDSGSLGVSGSGSGRVLREAAVSGRSQAVRATRLRSDTWAQEREHQK